MAARKTTHTKSGARSWGILAVVVVVALSVSAADATAPAPGPAPWNRRFLQPKEGRMHAASYHPVPTDMPRDTAAAPEPQPSPVNTLESDLAVGLSAIGGVVVLLCIIGACYECHRPRY
jgi:hypothetical protein